MTRRLLLVLAALPALSALSACTPVRAAGNVAIGTGQIALAGADLLI